MFLLKVGVVIGPHKYEKVFDAKVLLNQILEHLPPWLVHRRTGQLLAQRQS